jgi:hypothetical protein
MSYGAGIRRSIRRDSFLSPARRPLLVERTASSSVGDHVSDRAAEEALGFEAGFPVSLHFIERRERESVSALDCLLINFLRE